MASPIGPVGLLCLNKNALPDRWRGIFAAAGMALAYGIVSFCVLFGLQKVSGILESCRCGLEIVAGLILIVMGWRGLRKKDDDGAANMFKGRKRDYFGDFSASFAMTLFNPVPFATFAVMLTTFKILKGQLNLIVDIEFAALVTIGTMLFWAVVNQILHMVKKRSTSDWCRFISRGAAVGLLVFGFLILIAGLNLGLKTLLGPPPPPDPHLLPPPSVEVISPVENELNFI